MMKTSEICIFKSMALVSIAFLIMVLTLGMMTVPSDAEYPYNPEEIMYLTGVEKAAYKNGVCYSLYDINGDDISELFILTEEGVSEKRLDIYCYDDTANDARLILSLDNAAEVYSKGDESGFYAELEDDQTEIYKEYALIDNEIKEIAVIRNSADKKYADLPENSPKPLLWVGSDQWADGSIIGAASRIPDPGPQNDFYLSSNHGWLSAAHSDTPGIITSGTDDLEETVLRNKIEMLTDREKYQGRDVQILRDYYDMASDWQKRDADGIDPVIKYLDAAYSISTLPELTDFLTNPELNPFSILLTISITLDEKDTSHWAVELGEDNFSVLPRLYHNGSREYIEDVRSDFDIKARHVLSRAGYPEQEADKIMTGCYKLEEILLPLAWPNESDKESSLYGFQPFEMVTASCKNFPLKSLMNAYRITGGNIHVHYPGYLEKLDEIYTEENLFMMKAYLIAHTAAAASMYLDFEAVSCLESPGVSEKERKEFLDNSYQAEVLSPRELLGVAEENAYMTFFVDHATRTDLIGLAERIRDTFRELLSHEEWMSDAGKAAAIEKLDNMSFSVIAPDVLIDSSYLAPDPDKSFLDNNASIMFRRMKHNGEFAGKPREKGEWRYDLRPEIASTVTNAFYYGVFNQFFVFSGFVDDAIYRPEMPMEEKLAWLGEIIGHELTHGFDPNGIGYDKNGNMVMTDACPYGWMPETDYQAFMMRAQKIADYFDGIHPFPYGSCPGGSQWGEAAADFGGLTISLKIAEKIDGFDYDRFFRAYAELWRKQTTLEWERHDIYDTHPLSHLRINVTVQQFDEFFAVYDVKKGDGMYLEPEKRIRIW